MLTRNASAVFKYAGAESDPVTDGTEQYRRSPSGELLGMARGATSLLVGDNRHGDVSFTLNASSGVVADSVVNDPFGKSLGTTGTKPAAGFQGDWTDPGSGLVWMAARWYNPNTGTFMTRDSYGGSIGASLTLNRYAYGLNDPLRYVDPTGHRVEYLDGGVVDTIDDVTGCVTRRNPSGTTFSWCDGSTVSVSGSSGTVNATLTPTGSTRTVDGVTAINVEPRATGTDSSGQPPDAGPSASDDTNSTPAAGTPPETNTGSETGTLTLTTDGGLVRAVRICNGVTCEVIWDDGEIDVESDPDLGPITFGVGKKIKDGAKGAAGLIVPTPEEFMDCLEVFLGGSDNLLEAAFDCPSPSGTTKKVITRLIARKATKKALKKLGSIVIEETVDNAGRRTVKRWVGKKVDSIWDDGINARGLFVEEYFGGNNLHPNFKTIDQFFRKTGEAVSIKSFDLKNSYRGPLGEDRLERTLLGYLDELDNFEEWRVGSAIVRRGEVKSRTIKIGLSVTRSKEQMDAIERALSKKKHIRVEIAFFS